MAGLSVRATLVGAPASIAAASAISTKLITHDTRLAIAAAAIGAAAAVAVAGLSLWADLRMTRTMRYATVAECALERRRFKAAISSCIYWRFSPKHAAARRDAAASYQPLGLLDPAAQPTVPEVTGWHRHRRPRPPIARPAHVPDYVLSSLLRLACLRSQVGR